MERCGQGPEELIEYITEYEIRYADAVTSHLKPDALFHHDDWGSQISSYAANLVPEMIEMGIDVFQGCLTTNNVPELVKKYGGKISFMGDLNNGVIDTENWTQELVRKEVERACKTNGKHYFIPCLCQGLPMSTYPGYTRQ
jgi:hypothetical protein